MAAATHMAAAHPSAKAASAESAKAATAKPAAQAPASVAAERRSTQARSTVAAKAARSRMGGHPTSQRHPAQAPAIPERSARHPRPRPSHAGISQAAGLAKSAARDGSSSPGLAELVTRACEPSSRTEPSAGACASPGAHRRTRRRRAANAAHRPRIARITCRPPRVRART
jgi:hypothetical protein